MTPPILEGSLVHFGPFHVLRMLRGAGATGRLELRLADETASVWIEDGRTMFARTTGAMLRVGDILIERGHLVAEAVEFAAAIQTDTPGERLGRMLVDSGALTDDQLREAIESVQRDLFARLMRRRDGLFRFADGERVAGEDIRLDMAAELEPLHAARPAGGDPATDGAGSDAHAA